MKFEENEVKNATFYKSNFRELFRDISRTGNFCLKTLDFFKCLNL